jgi:hypothetical protein
MTPEDQRAKKKAYHAKHYAANREKIIARNKAYHAALGYVPGNVMVVSWRANTLKGNATLAELQTLVANFAVITALREVRK